MDDNSTHVVVRSELPQLVRSYPVAAETDANAADEELIRLIVLAEQRASAASDPISRREWWFLEEELRSMLNLPMMTAPEFRNVPDAILVIVGAVVFVIVLIAACSESEADRAARLRKKYEEKRIRLMEEAMDRQSAHGAARRDRARAGGNRLHGGTRALLPSARQSACAVP